MKKAIMAVLDICRVQYIPVLQVLSSIALIVVIVYLKELEQISFETLQGVQYLLDCTKKIVLFKHSKVERIHDFELEIEDEITFPVFNCSNILL